MLTVVFYGVLGVALMMCLAAALSPSVRFPLLLVAAVMFALAGVLAILSIGVLFLIAAIVCVVLAVRSRNGATARGI